MYDNTSSSKVIYRTRDEIGGLFGNFELVDPGICWTLSWHPEESSPRSPVLHFTCPNQIGWLAGIGRKP
jgi:hypothetical protein